MRHDVVSCLKLREISKPTIACIHGLCIFHAWALASAMDLIFVADDARVMPTWVEFCDIPWQVGARRAKEFLFEPPQFLSGEQLVGMGLANRSVPAERLFLDARAYALRVAKQPPFSLRMIKLACNQVDSQQGYEGYVRAALPMWINMVQAPAHCLASE